MINAKDAYLTSVKNKRGLVSIEDQKTLDAIDKQIITATERGKFEITLSAMSNGVFKQLCQLGYKITETSYGEDKPNAYEISWKFGK